MKRARRIAEVGDVFSFQLTATHFGACQVLAAREQEEMVEIAPLDYFESGPVTATRAPTLGVLERDWANWSGGAARCLVESAVPWWAERVAQIPPVASFETECTSFAGWDSAHLALHRHLWRRSERSPRSLDDTRVSISLGGKAVDIRRDAFSVEIAPNGMLNASINAPVDFAKLDQLPHLTQLGYTGEDASVVDFVVRRRLLEFSWQDHAATQIDLRDSRLTRLSISANAQSLVLRAPDTLQTLIVNGHAERLTVECAYTAFPFRLVLVGPTLSLPPRGLEAVEVVDYLGLVDADTAALSAYTSVQELRLLGAPGKLRNAFGLQSLPTLRELWIQQLYELHAPEWPAVWPSLDKAIFDGVRKLDADAIRLALQDVPEVVVSHTRSDAWIAANLGNPFHDWGDDNPAFGRAACAAWKKAKTAANKLGAEAETNDAEKLLRVWIAELNRLHQKYDIDTLRRETAADAYRDVARELGVDDDLAMAWFDEQREFQQSIVGRCLTHRTKRL